MKRILTHDTVMELAFSARKQIESILEVPRGGYKVYPVPRGGIPAAYALAATGLNMRIVTSPGKADLIFDDLIDSGATRLRYGANPFFALLNKQTDLEYKDSWVAFPWEVSETHDSSFADNITRLLQFVGEDPTRGGLLETPHRVVKAWEEWTSGYAKDPKSVLKVFADGGENYDQIVLVRDIPFYSQCEHHLAPFFGIAHVGYIPNGKVVGLSKIPEVVDIFARRLQVQERLTNQIADALWEHLEPKAVGVVMSARHMCMESRGKKKAGSSTVTSALRGTMASEIACRSEFMSLIKI